MSHWVRNPTLPTRKGPLYPYIIFFKNGKSLPRQIHPSTWKIYGVSLHSLFHQHERMLQSHCKSPGKKRILTSKWNIISNWHGTHHACTWTNTTQREPIQGHRPLPGQRNFPLTLLHLDWYRTGIIQPLSIILRKSTNFCVFTSLFSLHLLLLFSKICYKSSSTFPLPILPQLIE